MRKPISFVGISMLLLPLEAAAQTEFVGKAIPGASSVVVNTWAGTADKPGATDGTAGVSSFKEPMGIAVKADGTLYVADQGNSTIRAITPAGRVMTFAGTAGLSGSTDATGTAARFDHPAGLAVDAQGNVYVADGKNHTIRKIAAAGEVSTVAGTAKKSGIANGAADVARFNLPHGVAIDSAGMLYVADTFNHTIRKVTPAGFVTTIAGIPGRKGSIDGPAGLAQFNCPAGIAVDAHGTVYVADNANHTIRKITPAGMVSTLAGTAKQKGSSDGIGKTARFRYPTGVAVDVKGALYVADYFNSIIRKVLPNGQVITLAGLATSWQSLDGIGPDARFNFPSGICADANGVLFVTDMGGNTVRRLQ